MIEEAHMSNESMCVITCVATLVAGVVSSLITIVFQAMIESKRCARIAKANMEMLHKELQVGLKQLRSMQAGGGNVLLPTKAWEKLHLSDALISWVMKKAEKFDCDHGFPPCEVFSHLKNYYCYICGNINSMVNTGLSPNAKMLQNYVDATTKLEATLQVITSSL